MLKRLISVIVIWLSLTGIISAQDTLKVLFVGNSYVFMSDIPSLTSKISAGTNTYIIASSSTVGGAQLSNHWKEEGGLKTKQIIAEGAFDFVILQEQSMGTIQRPDEFFQYVKLFAKYCRKHGAEPALYQTWAREYAPNTQDQISKAYEQAAQTNEALLIPIGDVWAIIREQDPEIGLYLNDGSHQSAKGALLVACTMVKMLTNQLPESEFLMKTSKDISPSELSTFLDAIEATIPE